MSDEKSPSASNTVETPLDLIRLSVGERVTVKCRGDRVLQGLLHAYDEHLNIVMGEVTETVSTREVDEDTFEEVLKKDERQIPLLFVRGDGVILVSPPLRTGA